MADFQCQTCGKHLETQQDLLAHELEHAPRFECGICGETFRTKEEAYTHKTGQHGKRVA